mmetsp:Transcript_90858/g.231204  ORF Transcript_90858/g.231204 Transcript_90858/m.231204 type:complete len:202 (+) Transcript_90858:1053-1658(+)
MAWPVHRERCRRLAANWRHFRAPGARRTRPRRLSSARRHAPLLAARARRAPRCEARAPMGRRTTPSRKRPKQPRVSKAVASPSRHRESPTDRRQRARYPSAPRSPRSRRPPRRRSATQTSEQACSAALRRGHGRTAGKTSRSGNSKSVRLPPCASPPRTASRRRRMAWRHHMPQRRHHRNCRRHCWREPAYPWRQREGDKR